MFHIQGGVMALKKMYRWHLVVDILSRTAFAFLIYVCIYIYIFFFFFHSRIVLSSSV